MNEFFHPDNHKEKTITSDDNREFVWKTIYPHGSCQDIVSSTSNAILTVG